MREVRTAPTIRLRTTRIMLNLKPTYRFADAVWEAILQNFSGELAAAGTSRFGASSLRAYLSLH